MAADSGARTQMADSTGTISYGYDNIYRLTSATIPPGKNLPPLIAYLAGTHPRQVTTSEGSRGYPRTIVHALGPGTPPDPLPSGRSGAGSAANCSATRRSGYSGSLTGMKLTGPVHATPNWEKISDPPRKEGSSAVPR